MTVYGYVDHQSSGLLQRFLKDNDVSLEEFILNKKYVIIIDGDEYCEFENLIDSKIVNVDELILYPLGKKGRLVTYEEKKWEENDT